MYCCSCISKDNKNSANHNGWQPRYSEYKVVLASAKIIKIQLITTNRRIYRKVKSCSCISKDNKNSANHNTGVVNAFSIDVVLASAKIIKIQLITTRLHAQIYNQSCSCISKDNKNSANHNTVALTPSSKFVVLASAKIIKIQLITTTGDFYETYSGCSCISKDNKNSANHNYYGLQKEVQGVVLASAKIIKIQLITTISPPYTFLNRCSCISKDNKNSANHNTLQDHSSCLGLFLHQQR